DDIGIDGQASQQQLSIGDGRGEVLTGCVSGIVTGLEHRSEDELGRSLLIDLIDDSRPGLTARLSGTRRVSRLPGTGAGLTGGRQGSGRLVGLPRIRHGEGTQPTRLGGPGRAVQQGSTVST